MTQSPDERTWRILLGEIGQVRLRLTQVAPDMFPLSAPHLGAAPERLVEAETRLGKPLDPQHRALLAVANGWPDLVLSGSFLSTEDLGQGPAWQGANERLDILYEDGETSALPPREELLPIYINHYGPDIFVLWTEGPATDGGRPVLWIANELVDQWPDVHQWWLALIAIANRTLDRVLEAERPRA